MHAKPPTVTILDCTIRDGGYYTGWNFDEELINNYLTVCGKLPVDIVEIGYRGVKSDIYYGDYFYLSPYLLNKIKYEHPNLFLSVCIDEKDVSPDSIEALLTPCLFTVNMVRIPVDPERLYQGIALAIKAKKMGFMVCLNIMYLSKWHNDEVILSQISKIKKDEADYIYLVDSFGSTTPAIVEKVIKKIKEQSTIPLGFHGHNNLELALANAITAIENGCTLIDVTFTGMGRGAGNLKTELFLTYLHAIGQVNLNLNDLSEIVGQFEKLKEQYKWGTNFPYMISGAFSLPQKHIMRMLNEHKYSLKTIVTHLQHQKTTLVSPRFPHLSNQKKYEQAIIIGNGEQGRKYMQALYKHVKHCYDKKINICFIHTNSSIYSKFIKWDIVDHFCCFSDYETLPLKNDGITNVPALYYILPPRYTRRKMNIPASIKKYCVELEKLFDDLLYEDDPFSIALQLTLNLACSSVLLFAFDGYQANMNENEKAQIKNNQLLMDQFLNKHMELHAVTPTTYLIQQQTLNFQLNYENSSSYSRTV